MAKFKKCPNCGAHLDHGEVCDCGKRKLYIEKLDRATWPKKENVPTAEEAARKDTTTKPKILYHIKVGAARVLGFAK